ncbi:MAG: Cytosine/adenosine deaminase [Paenibacillus sp.]|jgi:tRNA(Arg) A34 adenosine deaminase TadA|nr:Cytosine/adenosine deaminase [Paenibacillus sp.]
MAWKDHLYYLRKCIEVSKRSVEHGNTPFGSILVDKEGNVLLEQENIEITESNCTGHAETTLMEKASKLYDKDFLKTCTLYSTFELCAMCSGAVYWGNVGRVIYALPENKLLQLTGSHEQNPTFDLPMREVFSRGQKEIKVIGPFLELENEVLEAHQGYWS